MDNINSLRMDKCVTLFSSVFVCYLIFLIISYEYEYDTERVGSRFLYYDYKILPGAGTGNEIEVISCPQKKTFKKPVRQFFYHALHKTGSTATRKHLRWKCSEDKYEYCSGGQPLSHLLQCYQPIEIVLDTGSMSAHRLAKCCSQALEKKPKLEAVVDHFYMHNTKNTREFLKNHLPSLEDMFRFTVLRHPVDQFISYYNYAKSYRHFSFKFISMVNQFYQHTTGNLTIGKNDILWKNYKNLANYQTQELTGWNGTGEDLNRSLNYLQSLDFVGIYEDLGDVWTLLKSNLGWTNSYAFSKNSSQSKLPIPKVSKRNPVSEDLYRKIEIIQWADLKLYELGRTLWLNCFYKP